MSSDLLRVVAKVQAKQEQVEAVKAILTALIEPTRAETGCLQYELLQNKDDQTEFVFVETWTSKKALTEHLATEHLQKALRETEELLTKAPDIREYQQLF